MRDCLSKNLHESQWRDRWLNIIAWSIGYLNGQDNAGRNLIDHLRKRKQSIVAIFDGLEDLFQDILSSQAQQTALRSLLQDVPDWLEQQVSRPLGLIVFVRTDMILYSIRQNFAQFLARYEPYTLRWDAIEVLRLVLWTYMQSNALEKLTNIHELDRNELVDELVSLWGRKLGSERSKEASTADFVIAALSDFNGQIQARDLIRLLNKSAQESLTDTYWGDRLLIPGAIRKAVRVCGEKKIEEISIENSSL